jgi:hypothetical protein
VVEGLAGERIEAVFSACFGASILVQRIGDNTARFHVIHRAVDTHDMIGWIIPLDDPKVGGASNLVLAEELSGGIKARFLFTAGEREGGECQEEERAIDSHGCSEY